MKSLFKLLLFLLTSIYFLSMAASREKKSSEFLYSQGKYEESLALLQKEIRDESLDDSAMENKHQLAAELFRVYKKMSIADLRSIYGILLKKKSSSFLKERLKGLLEGLSLIDSSTSLQIPNIEKTLANFESKKGPVLSYDHIRYGHLSALSLALSRELIGEKRNTEWLFYLGWAKELQSGSGEVFLEDYLSESKIKSKNKARALSLLRQHYEKEYPKGIPDEIKAKLSQLEKNL